MQLVSQELIRIAILWHEMWHEALEEASRLYFGESNVEAMLQVLLPLHELMEKTGPSTLKEIAFVQVSKASRLCILRVPIARGCTGVGVDGYLYVAWAHWLLLVPPSHIQTNCDSTS